MKANQAMTAEALAEYVIEATTAVFSSMVSMEIKGEKPLDEMTTKFQNSITGMVGLAGIYSGLISIHCPIDLATKITAQMLFMDTSEVTKEDIHDAIKEIANMLGGSAKQVLSKGGLDLNLSIPTALSGEEYEIEEAKTPGCVMIPFDCENSRFLVGLKLKKEAD